MNDMIYMKYMNFLYILLGEEVLQEKNWENYGLRFCKCLVKLGLTNYCFYRKKCL